MASKTEGKSATSANPPANPLVGLRDEIDEVFNNFMRGGWPAFGRWGGFDPFQSLRAPFSLTGAGLAPNVDVSETEQAYEIKAELPGVEEKDIELTLKDNMLSLKAEKKSEREEKSKNYHLSERTYGVYQRAFQLPDNVDADKISTGFAKGVLSITLPKTTKTPPNARRIEVKAG